MTHVENVGKLEDVIERRRAVNLVAKLQSDLAHCIEAKTYRSAIVCNNELCFALLKLVEVETALRETQTELFTERTETRTFWNS